MNSLMINESNYQVVVYTRINRKDAILYTCKVQIRLAKNLAETFPVHRLTLFIGVSPTLVIMRSLFLQ